MRKNVETGFFFIAFVAIIGALIITALNEASFNISQVLLMLALVLITYIYAMRTSDIAKATRAQADASVKMAKETKEQRLSEARPYILLRLNIGKDELLQWDDTKSSKRPREFAVTMRNEGKGPAINLWAALWHRHKTHFLGESKGYLTPSEEWQTTISRLTTMIEEGEGWLPKLGEIVKQDDPGVIAVEYQDIHKRTWVSYLCLERHVDMPAYVMEGEQNIVELRNND